MSHEELVDAIFARLCLIDILQGTPTALIVQEQVDLLRATLLFWTQGA